MPRDLIDVDKKKSRPNKPNAAQLAEHEFRVSQERAKRSASRHEPKEKQVTLRGALSEFDEPSSARITSQLDFMSSMISELSAMVYELEERISPILLPPVTMPADPDVAAQATSEVSRVIDEHNGRIREIQERIRQINMRVQL